ncbi:hypothetical protein [Haloferula sp. A504]|uniref:hypothetical protein n=1 Tax=Haloferula sp. A504 TaxID=3373601 RepID=UPI0031BE3C5F|nr:hypothetical protein [Verrucomicrobiaceae bacterium E54]
MRSILLLIPALLASCGPTISQREVLGRARAEVAVRETWADSALIKVRKRPAFPWSHWKIQAGQLDESNYPLYEGLDLVPGTERELRFSRSGCLVRYGENLTGCNDRYLSGVPAPAPSK